VVLGWVFFVNGYGAVSGERGDYNLGSGKHEGDSPRWGKGSVVGRVRGTTATCEKRDSRRARFAH